MKILSKNELKDIKGGNLGSGCCWHNEDWSANECGLPRSTAQSTARDRAIGGEQTWWCCASCIFE